MCFRNETVIDHLASNKFRVYLTSCARQLDVSVWYTIIIIISVWCFLWNITTYYIYFNGFSGIAIPSFFFTYMLNAFSGTRNVTVWHLSVCLSHLFCNLNRACCAYLRWLSRGSMRCDRHMFWPDSTESQHTCCGRGPLAYMVHGTGCLLAGCPCFHSTSSGKAL